MSLARRLSIYNRDRKWRLFLQEMQPSAAMRVLDVGFAVREFTPGDNYIERHYPWPGNLTALGVHDPAGFSRRYPQVHAVRYDGRLFPFDDQSFDLVWSNAVIEHVGGFDRQVLFVKEMARVGKRIFFSTPNRGFPIELHTRLPFVHWLPKAACDRCLRRLGQGFAAGDYMHLLTRRGLKRVLHAAGVNEYRIVANRLLGWPMDFVVLTGLSGVCPGKPPAP